MINWAGIDSKEARKTVFLTADAKKVVTPKSVTHTALLGKVELTVTFKVGTKLKAIRQAIDSSRCYASESCVDYILSGEEAADRIDPNRTSDAFMYAEPELDEEKVVALSTEEKLDRYAWFVAICNKVAETDILNFILENAPKKKNGTFAKNKLAVVAALPIVFSAEMGYYEIVGKAKNDNLLEITIQERKFSEDEWIRTKDNVYLEYLAHGKAESNTKPQLAKIKISHKRLGKKVTIEIPAVQLANGKLAIDAKPYRPISDFACVTGTDAKGYEILEPENNTNCEYAGVEFKWDLLNSVTGIWVIWSYLDEPAKYIRTGKKAYKMRTEIFTGTQAGKKIPERCLTENYIAEIAYQLLCVMDGINEQIKRPTIAEEMATTLKRNKDGSLKKYGTSEIAASHAPGRKLPLVTGTLRLLNEDNNSVRVVYVLSHRHGDDWSEYEGD